jgi:hypothetical protein
MTTVREIVELPGMPAWFRVALGLFAIVVLRVAHVLAEPLLASGWTWSHGLPFLLALVVGLDALHAAVRKRWPLVLFTDLLLARLFSGRWR